MSQQQDCYLLLCLEEAGGAPQGSYKMTFYRPTLCIGLPKLSKADLSGQALGFWASTESFWALLKLNSLNGWADSSWRHDVRARWWCRGCSDVLWWWVSDSLGRCVFGGLYRSPHVEQKHLDCCFSPAEWKSSLNQLSDWDWFCTATWIPSELTWPHVCSEFLNHKPINGTNYLSVDTWHYSFSAVHSNNFDTLLI